MPVQSNNGKCTGWLVYISKWTEWQGYTGDGREQLEILCYKVVVLHGK